MCENPRRVGYSSMGSTITDATEIGLSPEEEKRENIKKLSEEIKNNPFLPFIKRGYYMSTFPLEYDKEHLVRYAKYVLCKERNMLFYDPIWNSYTDDYLLDEFYAVMIEKNKEYRESLELALGIKSTNDLEKEDYIADVLEMAAEHEREEKKKEESIMETEESLRGDDATQD